MRKLLAFVVLLLLPALAFAQPRPGAFTTLTVSSTLNVTGTSTLGTINSSGAVTLTYGTAGTSRALTLNSATDNSEIAWVSSVNSTLYIRYVGTCLEFVNDAYTTVEWQACQDGAVTTTGVATSAGVTNSGAQKYTGAQTATTADGEQTITLTATTSVLKVTPGGTGTDDTIIGLTGGVDGRLVHVCSETTATTNGNILLRYNDGSATAANRITNGDDTTEAVITMGVGHCVGLLYDGTVSRWRFVEDNPN